MTGIPECGGRWDMATDKWLLPPCGWRKRKVIEVDDKLRCPRCGGRVAWRVTEIEQAFGRMFRQAARA